MTSKRLLAAAIGGAALMMQGEAFAQALEEIIVTAQRRVESIQDVPVSVTALTESALDMRNVNTLEQLSLAATSLQMGQDNRFSVRGVGTLAFSQTVDSSVAIALDEVNLGRQALASDLFTDLARIEVLNGPQGLLFGKNASAGLMNIISQEPVLGEFEGFVDLEYNLRDTTPDDGDGYIFKGAYNIPIGDNSALRLNAHWSEQDPIAQHIGGGADRVDEQAERRGLRAKYLVEANDQLSVYVIGEYHEEEGIGGIFDRTYRELGEGSFKAFSFPATGIEPGDENFYYQADGDMFRDLETGGAQAKVTYLINDELELTNIAAWKYYDLHQQVDVDWTGDDETSRNENQTTYDQYSNELRLGVSTDRWDGQVGLYLFKSESSSQSQLRGNPFIPGLPPIFDAVLGGDYDIDTTNESQALFGQFNFRMTDDLQLIAGARVTHDEIEIEGVQGGVGFYAVDTTPFRLIDEDHSNTNFSWKVGLQYDISYDSMLYATVSSGYKGPGFNEGAPVGLPLLVEDETSINYEVGAKTSWLDQRLLFNATLFLQKFEDYQSETFNPSSQSFIIQNAAELETMGAELSLTALPFEGLTINAAVTLLDSEFGDYEGAQCYPGQPGCNPPPPFGTGTNTFNADGNDTPLSPDVTATLQGIYEFPVSGAVNGFVEGNYYYRSKTNFLVSNAPGAEVDAANIFGASIGLRDDQGGWEVALFCKNCTDEVMPSFISIDPGDQQASNIATYVQAWGYNSVRTIGLRTKFNF